MLKGGGFGDEEKTTKILKEIFSVELTLTFAYIFLAHMKPNFFRIPYDVKNEIYVYTDIIPRFVLRRVRRGSYLMTMYPSDRK